MRTTLKPLLLPLVLATGVVGLMIARSGLAQYNTWCDNPVPTPSPTPVPPPPPPCEPTECDKCTNSPCYVSTGTYVTDEKDLFVRTVGFPLVVDRHYQSSLAIDGPMGVGWTSTITPRIYYALYLFSAPSTYQKQAYVVMPTGARYAFTDAGGGSFTPPLGRHDALVRNADGSFDLTLQRTRSVMHFGVTGALETMRDDYGNILTWAFDVNGRVQRLSDSAGSGRYVDITWGPDGRISSARDSAGRVVQYGFDPNGNLTRFTDAANRVTTYGYTQGRFVRLLNRVTDHWNRIITDVTYDATDRVTSYTEKGEVYSYTYGYGGNGATTAKTDSQGNTFIYPFGASGLISDRTPPAGAGGATHTDYYPDGLVQLFVDGVGVKTYNTYTPTGMVQTITRDYQGPDAVRFDYAYDPTFPSKLISITPKNPTTNQVNPDWRAWLFDYYQPGSAAPGSLHHVYRVKDTGASETIATYEYNTHGQETRWTSATGGIADYGYDAVGNFATMTNPANNDAGTRPTFTWAYDALGRATSVTDPSSQSTTFGYDNVDRVTSVTLPKPVPGSPLVFSTTYTYDIYDGASGLLFTNTADANNKITKLGRDQFGQLVRVIDAASGVTQYTYIKGRLTSITDANNNTTSYGYDAAHRWNGTTFPDGAHEQYTYSGDNMPDTRTDRKNQVINYDFDHFKRLKARTWPGGAAVSYAYQGEKLTQVVDSTASPTETHLFAYDSSYRVASETQGTRGTINYQHLLDDRLSNYAVQGGPSASYTYYADGRANTIVWSAAPGQFKYTYTLTGLPATLTLPSGMKRIYSFDNQARLTQLQNLSPSSATLATYAYGYDFNYTTGQSTMLGQRTSLTATVPAQGLSGHLFTYSFDPLYQLKTVSYPSVAPFSGEVDSWTYDAIGNRLTSTVNAVSQTYAYQKVGSNPLNWQRLASDGSNSYTYDANGNTQSKGGTSFTWNADDELTAIPSISSYTYDFRRRRSSRTVGATTTTYAYVGRNVVREGGASTAEYLFGPGLDTPLAMSRGGQIYYYAVDALGSVGLVTNATGTVQDSYLYDAWGQARSQTGALPNPFGYTAREFGEAGTLFYRARYYAPGTGRFMSEDPLRLWAGPGLYAYVLGDPVKRTDPLGLQAPFWVPIAPYIQEVIDFAEKNWEYAHAAYERNIEPTIDKWWEDYKRNPWIPWWPDKDPPPPPAPPPPTCPAPVPVPAPVPHGGPAPGPAPGPPSGGFAGGGGSSGGGGASGGPWGPQ